MFPLCIGGTIPSPRPQSCTKVYLSWFLDRRKTRWAPLKIWTAGLSWWFLATRMVLSISVSDDRGTEKCEAMHSNRFPGSSWAIFCSTAVLPTMINDSSLTHKCVDLSRVFVEVCLAVCQNRPFTGFLNSTFQQLCWTFRRPRKGTKIFIWGRLIFSCSGNTTTSGTGSGHVAPHFFFSVPTQEEKKLSKSALPGEDVDSRFFSASPLEGSFLFFCHSGFARWRLVGDYL